MNVWTPDHQDTDPQGATVTAQLIIVQADALRLPPPLTGRWTRS